MSHPQNELFTLVTDRGYLRKREIVWETLSSVGGEGDSFTDSNFQTSPSEFDAALIDDVISSFNLYTRF